MKRRLGKILASLLGALLLTVSAVAPASAQEFHAEISNPTLSGSGTASTFNLGGNLIKCTTSSYSGTASTATASSWTLSLFLGLCSAFGFSNTTINSSACDLVLSAGSETGDLRLSCSSGGSINFTVFIFGTPACTVRIKPQTTGTPTGITNGGSGSNRDITYAASLTELEYSEDAGGVCKVGSGTTGTYEGGTATLKGFNGSNVQIGVWRA